MVSKRAFLTAAFLLATAMAAPALADPPDQVLGSRYTVDGTNANGTKYRGTAAVSYDNGTDQYRVVWEIARDTYTGAGRYSQHERIFEVTYDGGVAVFTVLDSGVLQGEWGASLTKLTGKEVWTPSTKTK